jgi:hypothetical protein
MFIDGHVEREKDDRFAQRCYSWTVFASCLYGPWSYAHIANALLLPCAVVAFALACVLSHLQVPQHGGTGLRVNVVPTIAVAHVPIVAVRSSVGVQRAHVG